MNQFTFDMCFIIIIVASALSLMEDAEEVYKPIVVCNLLILIMYYMFVGAPRYTNKIKDKEIASALRWLLLFVPSLIITLYLSTTPEYDFEDVRIQFSICVLTIFCCLTIIRFLYRKYWLKRNEKTNTKT